MKRQFYMVLPSDSSMMYFPENTASRFTTLLPHEIRLSGDWAVALTEIQFPCNFLQIRDKNESYIGFVLGRPPATDAMGTYHVQQGLYSRLEDLLDVLNDMPFMRKHLFFACNDRGYVTVTQVCKEPECKSDLHLIQLSKKLESILGFEHTGEGNNGYEITRDVKIVGHHPASLTRALPDKMFVYCDICDPYVTGDVQTSLLRIVPCDNRRYNYGSTRTVSFAPANYIPLLHTSFRTIEIDIRDTQGNSIPFEYGPLNVTLHFKRVE